MDAEFDDLMRNLEEFEDLMKVLEEVEAMGTPTPPPTPPIMPVKSKAKAKAKAEKEAEEARIIKRKEEKKKAYDEEIERKRKNMEEYRKARAKLREEEEKAKAKETKTPTPKEATKPKKEINEYTNGKGDIIQVKGQSFYHWVNLLFHIRSGIIHYLVKPNGDLCPVLWRDPSKDEVIPLLTYYIDEWGNDIYDDISDDTDDEKVIGLVGEFDFKTGVITLLEEDKRAKRIKLDIFVYNGKRYFKDENDILYNPKTKEPVGQWDPVAKEINELETEDDDDDVIIEKRLVKIGTPVMKFPQDMSETYKELFTKDKDYKPNYVCHNGRFYINANGFLFDIAPPNDEIQAKYQVVRGKYKPIKDKEGDGSFSFEIRGHDLTIIPDDMEVDDFETNYIGVYDPFTNSLAKKVDFMDEGPALYEFKKGELLKVMGKVKGVEVGVSYRLYNDVVFNENGDPWLYKGKTAKWVKYKWDKENKTYPITISGCEFIMNKDGKIWYKGTDTSKNPVGFIQVKHGYIERFNTGTEPDE